MLQQLVIKEEMLPEQQELNLSVDQKDVKQEQEEVWASNEGQQLHWLETEKTKFLFARVPVKTENDDEIPQSSQVLQNSGQILMEIDANPGPEKKRRRTGPRCVVYGCSNEAQHGYFMHKLPGKKPSGQERYNPLQRAWISFIGRKRQFDTKVARTYKSDIVVCCGHFRKEDYDRTDAMMFKAGLRTHPPSLLKTAVPTIDVAQHPFHSVLSSSSASTSTLYASVLPLSQYPIYPSASFPPSTSSSSTASPSTLPGRAVSLLSYTSVTTTMTFVSSSSTISGTCTTSVLHTPKTSNRGSIYIRKKEMAAIYADYDRQEEKKRMKFAKEIEAERLRDFVNRTKGVQWRSQMRDQKVGTDIHVPRRSVKVQTKPRGISKGIQASVIKRPCTDSVLVQQADASTQTEE
ncbi:uncharacterized protein LOC117530231 [Thalassophryne amazonica]|uniref:uncharacterized protein LOC117530231 n=1 Tax=Thalassophryne amazonica TaxID=390379 RepID=UPI0014718688|nr:uncharacterized protein LOC117530231 [Thalassophryne amazonica]